MHRLLCALATMSGLALKEIKDPNTYAALLYAPPAAATSDAPWPLLLYLHGAGESGTDVRELISEGATGTPPVSLEQGVAMTFARGAAPKHSS